MTTRDTPDQVGWPLNTGASPNGDRAVVNGAGQAVSALRASVPSADRSGIWDYAKALGVALIAVAPDDISFGWEGDQFKIRASLSTTQEAEAVCEIIRHLTHRHLGSHRPMIHADIYGEPASKPSFKEALGAMFGDDAQGTSGSGD